MKISLSKTEQDTIYINDCSDGFIYSYIEHNLIYTLKHAVHTDSWYFSLVCASTDTRVFKNKSFRATIHDAIEDGHEVQRFSYRGFVKWILKEIRGAY